MRILLESAKKILEQEITFIMLLEHQRFSQYMFEEIFKVRFNKSFKLKKRTVAGRYMNTNSLGQQVYQTLNEKQLNVIDRLNQYDIGLRVDKIARTRIGGPRLKLFKASSF